MFSYSRINQYGGFVSFYIFYILLFKVLATMNKMFTSVFPSDFRRVFVWHLTGKILNLEFYPEAVFFECKLRISWSNITYDQDWQIGPQRVGSRIRWHQRLTSLKLQRVNAAYCTCKTRVRKYESSKLLLDINLGGCTCKLHS